MEPRTVLENGHPVKKVKVGGSIFGGLPTFPPDAIFHVKDSYNADKDPKKVNLGIGGTLCLALLDPPTHVCG